MKISENAYMNYMFLIESHIKDLKYKYNELQQTLNNWNDTFNPTSKISGLTVGEIKELQKDFIKEQQEYFKTWHELNKPEGGTDSGYIEFYGAGKMREIKSYLICKVAY
jgi:hypothetical protein